MFAYGAIEHQARRAWHTGIIPGWMDAIPPALGMTDPHDLDHANEPSELRTWLRGFAGDFGFTGGRYTHLGHRMQLRAQSERPPLRFVSSLGEDVDPWRAGDPSAPRAFSSLMPFAWTTKDSLDLPDHQRGWLSVERLRGVAAGIAIPVQDYLAGPAYVCLLGRTAAEIATLLQIEAQTLIYLAITFHNRAKDVLPPNRDQAVPLTDRELSCLRHAASGANITQTASLLGIATRTVELYFSNAVRKLGASNRIHAVAIALSSGLIQI